MVRTGGRNHAVLLASVVITRIRSRAHRGLRRVAARGLVSWMSLVGSAIGNRRRSRRGMVSQLGEWRRLLLAVVLGRHHVRVLAFEASGRCNVTILVVIVVGAAAEVVGTFVLIRTAVLRRRDVRDRAKPTFWSDG